MEFMFVNHMSECQKTGAELYEGNERKPYFIRTLSKQIKKLCEHDYSVEKIDFAVSNVWSSDTCSIKFPLYTNFFYKLVNILWLHDHRYKCHKCHRLIKIVTWSEMRGVIEFFVLCLCKARNIGKETSNVTSLLFSNKLYCLL